MSHIEAVYLAILRLAFLLAATIALVIGVVLAVTALLNVLARAPSPLQPVAPHLSLAEYVASRASTSPVARTGSLAPATSSAFGQFERQSASLVCDDEKVVLGTVDLELAHGDAACQQEEIGFAHQRFSSNADLQIYWTTIVPLWNAAKQSPATLGLTDTFGGIGIVYAPDKKDMNLLVESVIAGGPSASAGVRSRDRITEIDGQPLKQIVTGEPPDVQTARLRKLLLGTPGTRVVLTIMRNGAVIPRVTVTRAVVGTLADTSPAIAHANDVLKSFQSWQVAQVQNSIAERQRADADAQAAFFERKRRVGPTLYAAAIAGAVFMFISFFFLAVKIERNVRTIAQQSREAQ